MIASASSPSLAPNRPNSSSVAANRSLSSLCGEFTQRDSSTHAPLSASSAAAASAIAVPCS